MVVVGSEGFRLRPSDSLAFVDPRTREILERRRSKPHQYRRGWLMRRLLLLADLIGLTIAVLMSHLAFPSSPRVDDISTSGEFFLLIGFGLPLWVVLAKLYGLYESDEEKADHSIVDEFFKVFHLVTVGVWLFFIGVSWTGIANPPLGRLVALWILAVVFVTVGRASGRAVCRRRIAYLQNVVVVGAGDVGQMVARKILSHHEYGLNLVGFVDAQPKELSDELAHVAVLGTTDDLARVVDLLDVERIIVAFSNDSAEDTLAVIRAVQDFDVHIDIVPRLFEVVGSKVNMHTVEGISLVGLPPFRLSRSSRLMKRAMDVVLGSVGLILLTPVFVAVACLIKLDSRGPVLFRQTRMGAGEKCFRIYKFRTMRADAELVKKDLAHLNMHAVSGAEARMFKIPNDPRITRFGAFLRRSRIDELPQLINVVRGDMSLVGPRPLILEEDQHIVDWGRRRLNLKPGITGLWQALGASDIPFDEMVKLDYLYVTNWSLLEDVRLMCRTFGSLVHARRAY